MAHESDAESSDSQSDSVEKEIVNKLELEFEDRYTENDPDYVAAGGIKIPPCIENWYTRPQGQRGGHRGGGRRGSGRSDRDHYGNRGSRYDNQRHQDNRHRGDRYGNQGGYGEDDRNRHDPYNRR